MNILKTEESTAWQNPGIKRVPDAGNLINKTEKYTDRFKEAFINKARNDVTRYIVEQYFEGVKSGAGPESITSLFSENVDFYIPGHVKFVPGSDHRSGRAGVADFVTGLRDPIEPVVFDVGNILVDGMEAVAFGELKSRARSTGKIIDSEFVMLFSVQNALITRFRLFENSFAMARAMVN